MTIHHDKLAYGKLAPNMEELSEQQILAMINELSEEEEGEAENEQREDINKINSQNNIKKL